MSRERRPQAPTGEPDTTTEGAAAPRATGRDLPPEPPERDEGGDPPCWEGLVADHRDQDGPGGTAP